MDDQLNHVKNGDLFFQDGSIVSIQGGIMSIVGVILLLFNIGIIARLVYLLIQNMQGEDKSKEIKNCIIAVILVNVICGWPFVSNFITYYLNLQY